MTRKFGSRSEVWEESVTMTRGGLTKNDLMLSKTGRIVSRKKSEAAKAAYDKFGFNKRGEEAATIEEPEKKPKRRRKKKAQKE
jgi:hypothetical protein